MITLVEFKGLNSKPVLINPDQVTYIAKVIDGKTDIYFGAAHHVQVREDVSVVAAALTK